MECRSFFHDPAVSLPVVRRRAGELLLETALWYGELVLSRGRALWGGDSHSSRTAYHMAVGRLRKQGLIASRQTDGLPILELTEEGESRTSASRIPYRLWKRRWCGLWYVLVYDVPEKQRRLRDALRGFLRRKRMGCLQKSVWVSAHDVRPDYDDLVQAVGIDSVSFLVEAQNVLGRRDQDIVLRAWDFDRLGAIHAWYCEVCHHNAAVLCSGNVSLEQIRIMAREEVSAFLAAMQEDPMLPRELHPAGYSGPLVLKTHREFVRTVKRAVR
jgi:phenylacetic acid degradation operon negative regulatory protein